MKNIFLIIQWISIVQLLLIILILIVSYSFKIYTYFHNKHLKNIETKIKTILLNGLAYHNVQKLFIFKNYPIILMNNLIQFSKSNQTKEWKKINAEIIESILIPHAKICAKSSQWENRYIACQIFQFYPKDEEIIIELMQDPIPIVAITASAIAIKLVSQNIIDKMIDIFTNSRRIQQSFYSQIIAKADPKIILFIKNHLNKEQNLYKKAFCYKTLILLPRDNIKIETLLEDLNSNNIDLKISVLNYLAYLDPNYATKIAITFLNNEHWELRAKSAQILGEIGDESCISNLENSLIDSEWWVRIHAAEALYLLGEQGIKILKKQNINLNQDAYDVSKHILSNKDHNISWKK